ncbi:MAG: YcjX family protein [Pseudomonadota bacterium]
MSQTLRLPDFRFPVTDAGYVLSDLLTPTVRLGVTGLSRSGKTVFVTGLVQALLERNAVPEFAALTGIPGLKVYLEPQPDDDVPRFAYEDHLAALNGAEPHWPESTRRISQLRLTCEWPAQDYARRALGLPHRLHIDIIDYPGEWLIDLALLDQSFAEWSADALHYAQTSADPTIARAFLEFQTAHPATEPADEAVAIDGARLFKAYLAQSREVEPSRAILGPGRFLLPGDLEGSPLITFFPLDVEKDKTARSGSLHALLERRYESYKTHVVEPFFKKHFSRLDRQIVLIDVLTALNGGAKGLSDLEHGLEGVLKAFRPGANSWLSLLLPRRIDRIAFAATKADHIHLTSHGRLEAILEKAVSRATDRSQIAGAETQTFALAALRATENVDKVSDGVTYHCVRGRPASGEKVDGRTFNGTHAAVVFPGDLPDDPLQAFDPDVARVGQYAFTRFAPPNRTAAAQVEHDGTSKPKPWGATLGAPAPGVDVGSRQDWPHIGLDRIFAFLFGDHLP